jgi:predicted ATPase
MPTPPQLLWKRTADFSNRWSGSSIGRNRTFQREYLPQLPQRTRFSNCLLMRPEPDAAKAEAHFEHALAVAREQRAKSWELRAAMSMARLWRDQGKRDEARELLAPVCGWFTEGFDTIDLKEAKALLDELAA